MKKCTIIGISDSRDQWFEPKVIESINAGKVFSGGKRHHEIMNDLLPEDSVWIDITVPLSNVFEQYKSHEEIVVFASGDPLFFGFAATIQREVPDCDIKVFPYFNSLQMLAHRMCLPYQDMHVVSLTGRPWDKFDEALINGESLIGCLTDKKNTPDVIWDRMIEYGYDNYTMTIGECLGNENERITSVSASSSTTIPSSFSQPNCIILQKTKEREQFFGIPESDFELLDGRAKMITKASIRLITLSALNLKGARTFWDVGFCTGSVSIEAKTQFPHLHIESFEIRTECEEIMKKNMRRFGTPGINMHIGDFMETDISALPKPDAVFIGGHGGKLIEIIGKILDSFGAPIRFTINAVSENSIKLMYEAADKYNLMLVSDNKITLDTHNPINIITFVAK